MERSCQANHGTEACFELQKRTGDLFFSQRGAQVMCCLTHYNHAFMKDAGALKHIFGARVGVKRASKRARKMHAGARNCRDAKAVHGKFTSNVETHFSFLKRAWHAACSAARVPA